MDTPSSTLSIDMPQVHPKSRCKTNHTQCNCDSPLIIKHCQHSDIDMNLTTTSPQDNINHHNSNGVDSSRSNTNNRNNGNPSQLSLREQQQLRNQANINNNNNNNNNNNSNTQNGTPATLSLSITPPKFSSNFLSAEPTPQDSCNDHPAQGQSLQGSNNSLLGGSHDSLGSSISQSSNYASRRASFNLSTGSLNFNPSTSSSMASPSSPSYSTIAVARARAAAAAAAAGEGGQGATVDGDDFGQAGSGVFQGGALEQNPFSSWSSPSSSSVPSSSSKSQDLYHNSKQPRAPLSKSLTSSASSLLSNASASSTGSTSGSSPVNQSHLQENANAEREISMILDDFLFLGGDLVDEDQILELERLGIKRVLNMAANCDDELWIQRAGKDNGSYLKVGLLDHVDQDLKASLDVATKFIESSTTPVYVHCQAGKSRSVATVIGYLIQAKKWPLKKAYDHVVERRRIMSPNIGFVSQLIMLEERVLGDNAGGLVSTAGIDEEADPASRTTVIPWMVS